MVVVAFRMLPREVWSLPPLGTFNLHASLLPDYRGAAPINWAIVNGEKETGVTTFFIEETIDTGAILFSEKVSIGTEENAGDLHDRLMVIGARLVLKTVDAIASGSAKGILQNELVNSGLSIKKAPKIVKEHCRINWEDSGEHLHDLIRGMSPHPAAFAELKDVDGRQHILKIYRSRKEIAAHSFFPGQVISDGKTFIKIAVSDGYIHLLEVQPAGRKIMSNAEFLNGFGKKFSGNLR
jgi:methionyl-tRNA formyltransferase